MGNVGPETSRLLVSALVGPVAIVPACVLLELAATRLGFSLVPLLNASVFGVRDFTPSLGFAFAALLFVFYPAVFLLGMPAALVLRRMDKPGISGLIGAPLLLAVLLALTREHPDVKIVFAYCAIAVSAGCWGFYRIYR